MTNNFDDWDGQQDPRATGESPIVYSGLNAQHRRSPRWVGLALLMVAMGFTVATALLVLTDDGGSPPPVVPTADAEVVQAMTDVPSLDEVPTDEPPASPTPIEEPDEIIPVDGETVASSAQALPTADPDTIAALLGQPLGEVVGQRVASAQLNPFTISPDLPRDRVIRYEVVEGDTIESIARAFNISTDTIAWSNSRELMQRFLRQGDVLNIPPQDGAYIQARGTSRTFRQYADEYGVGDPFIILNSPYNPQLRDYGPDDIPPDGTQMFIPGGVSFDVVWPAAIEIIEEPMSGSAGGRPGGTAGEDTVFRVTFQRGMPGSCAPQIADGGTFWSHPLGSSSYRVMRGFWGTTTHNGIDLGAPQGTPILAANGGRVIFSGWNDFGYGYMVALIHGNTMTVYAHMVDQPIVGCGQWVDSGQTIGFVGSTGNSSGPHLHFEIRSRIGNDYVAQDPTFTIGF